MVNRVIAASPFRCRLWHLHPRLEEHITERSCEAELKSFARHGQLVPALGRRAPRGADHDIEIICGARRLFVARHFNQPLLVDLRDLSDRQAIIALEMENGQRLDLSPYERGLGYARWLRDRHFGSPEEIASALQMSRSRILRVLKLASLPDEVLEAFGSPQQIRTGWGYALAMALQDPQKRTRLLQASRDIAAISPPLPASEVHERLRAAVGQKACPKHASGKVVTAYDGAPLFEIKRQGSSILIVLPMQRVAAKSLRAIEESMALIMQPRVDTERRAFPQGAVARRKHVGMRRYCDFGVAEDFDAELEEDQVAS
jgi:ParB family chromosome partitioning protein